MTQSARGRPAALPIDRMMAVSLLVAVTVIVTYVVLFLGGDDALPAPLNGLIFAIVSTAVMVAVAKKLANELGQVMERMDARTARIHSVLVQQGVSLAETTGELPCLQSSPGLRDAELKGYANGYADGLARKPIPGKVVPFDIKRPHSS